MADKSSLDDSAIGSLAGDASSSRSPSVRESAQPLEPDASDADDGSVISDGDSAIGSVRRTAACVRDSC